MLSALCTADKGCLLLPNDSVPSRTHHVCTCALSCCRTLSGKSAPAKDTTLRAAWAACMWRRQQRQTWQVGCAEPAVVGRLRNTLTCSKRNQQLQQLGVCVVSRTPCLSLLLFLCTLPLLLTVSLHLFVHSLQSNKRLRSWCLRFWRRQAWSTQHWAQGA